MSRSTSSQFRSALVRWAAVAALLGLAVTSTVASDVTRPSASATLASDSSAQPDGLARTSTAELLAASDEPAPDTFDATSLPPVVIPDVGGVDVGMPPQLPADWISGYDMDRVVVQYDEATDRLRITIVAFGIVGDADGDGDPSRTSPELASISGEDPADFGGRESFAVQIDVDQDGVFDALLGVSSQGDMSTYVMARHRNFFPDQLATSFNYGDPIPEHDAGPPAVPTAGSPDLTVEIVDYSQLAATLGLDDDSLDFGLSVFVGSSRAIGIGNDLVPENGDVAVLLDAHLGDRVWVDDDLDGVQDPDESGLAGIVVDALDPSGALVASTVTDSDGMYDLPVRPGRYQVRFTLPAGHSFTERGAGGDVELDSDTDVLTGLTSIVTVDQGDLRLDLDAGVIVHDPAVVIEKTTNGIDADVAPGPLLRSGTQATFLYTVTNTGNLELVDLLIEDDLLGPVCVVPSLPVGESADCPAATIVQPGPYVNEGSVTAVPVINGSRLEPIGDTDLSHHTGSIDPAVTIEKTTNGVDADLAPGPELESGSVATFVYTVTNTGNVPLVDITVTDDQIGFVCDVTALPIGQSVVCEETHVVVPGPYANVGSVTASGSFDGQIIGRVTDSDASHHTGSVVTGVDVEKATNGLDADVGPGEVLPSGSTATFTFVITNTGNVPLHDVVAVDDVLGVVCEAMIIEVGSSQMCTATATVTPGPHVNEVTATATPRVQGEDLPEVTDSDLSHHSGSLDPAVSLEKSTNGLDADVAPGPTLRTGSLVSWTYVVANTGNVALTDLVVGDDREGVVCTIDRLDPGEQDSCSLDGVVGVGQYDNTGTVTAIPVFGGQPLPPVSASDASHHFGEQPCTPDVFGPLMWAGAIDRWDTGLVAAPGSTIRVLTHEPDSSPGQPHEQVFVFVGGVNLGSTPEGLGIVEFDAGAGGAVEIVHWSVVTGDVANPNSVAMAICGTDLT